MSFLLLVLVPILSILAVKPAIIDFWLNDFSSPIRNNKRPSSLFPLAGFSNKAYFPPEANFPSSVDFIILATDVSKVLVFASIAFPLYPFTRAAISLVSLTLVLSLVVSGMKRPHVLLLCK